MTAMLTRPAQLSIPTPRMPSEPVTRSTPAVAYQRVLHQTVRREFRMLAGLASWATADDAVRTGEITQRRAGPGAGAQVELGPDHGSSEPTHVSLTVGSK